MRNWKVSFHHHHLTPPLLSDSTSPCLSIAFLFDFIFPKRRILCSDIKEKSFWCCWLVVLCGSVAWGANIYSRFPNFSPKPVLHTFPTLSRLSCSFLTLRKKEIIGICEYVGVYKIVSVRACQEEYFSTFSHKHPHCKDVRAAVFVCYALMHYSWPVFYKRPLRFLGGLIAPQKIGVHYHHVYDYIAVCTGLQVSVDVNQYPERRQYSMLECDDNPLSSHCHMNVLPMNVSVCATTHCASFYPSCSSLLPPAGHFSTSPPISLLS